MLSDAFLSRLDTLCLAMKGRASGGAGGTRRSRQTGSSAEFSDYREYIPGDDIRRLDWNAMARFDKVFLKLFLEEQESAVTVLLDGSASMGEKWDTARKAAEAAGYLALTGGDRLRLVVLQEKGSRESPALAGRQAYGRLTQFLDTIEPSGGGTLTESVLRLQGLRKGMCFLISDCYETGGIGQALDSLRYRAQECAVIQTLSEFELDPALDGALKLTDSESGRTVDLLADRSALDAYRDALEAFLKEVRGNCSSREAAHLLLDSEEPFEECFIPLLSRNGMI